MILNTDSGRPYDSAFIVRAAIGVDVLSIAIGAEFVSRESNRAKGVRANQELGELHCELIG